MPGRLRPPRSPPPAFPAPESGVARPPHLRRRANHRAEMPPGSPPGHQRPGPPAPPTGYAAQLRSAVASGWSPRASTPSRMTTPTIAILHPPLSPRPLDPSAPFFLVPILFGLVRPLYGNADVLGLGGGEPRELHTELFEMQARHHLVELLRQDVHLLLVLGLI